MYCKWKISDRLYSFFKEKNISIEINKASCKAAHYSLLTSIKPKHSITYTKLSRFLIPQYFKCLFFASQIQNSNQLFRRSATIFFSYSQAKKKAFLLQIIFFYRKSYCTFSIERNSGNSKISQIVPCLKYFTFAKERRAFNQKRKGVKVVLILQCEKKKCLKHILHSCVYLGNHSNKDHCNTEIKSEKN